MKEQTGGREEEKKGGRKKKKERTEKEGKKERGREGGRVGGRKKMEQLDHATFVSTGLEVPPFLGLWRNRRRKICRQTWDSRTSSRTGDRRAHCSCLLGHFLDWSSFPVSRIWGFACEYLDKALTPWLWSRMWLFHPSAVAPCRCMACQKETLWQGVSFLVGSTIDRAFQLGQVEGKGCRARKRLYGEELDFQSAPELNRGGGCLRLPTPDLEFGEVDCSLNWFLADGLKFQDACISSKKKNVSCAPALLNSSLEKERI
ncbi:hypothetical protein L345_08571, partial [Ophiophagus hannah]